MTRAGGRFAARFVALDATTWLAPGEIVWDGRGRIVALRRPRGARVADACVLPGLVNAHAHLGLPALPAAGGPFPTWIDAVLAARRATTAATERALVRTAVHELLRSGTTAVGEVDATGQSAAVLARGPLAGRCYRELTGFDLETKAARLLVRQRWAPVGAAMAAGLSPHAPYSVSPALFRAAAARCRHLAIHCAEVPEEQQFLRTGGGPFAGLLERLGRLPPSFRAPGVGAVRWLERLGVLRPATQLVHCQELERGDAARIAAAGCSVVVCPGTIAWFRREPPPVPAWLAAGIPVALGTDSRASNTGLSLLADLRAAARCWPQLTAEQLLTMATAAGGRALGRAVGRLRRGGRADFVVLPAAATAAASLAAIVHGEAAPRATVVAGATVRGSGR